MTAGIVRPASTALGRGRVVGVVLLVAILSFGVWVRFDHLDGKVFGHDEVYTALRIAGYTRMEVKAERRLLDREGWHQYQSIQPDRGWHAVVRALRDDVHPPLYFFLARWWAQTFGSSVWTLRFLSALLGVLALPCLYWLARELFDERAVAWAAVALLAISPFHVLYAQEARQYSLWTVTILVSSAALLRAMRLGSPAAWALYAGAAALGLYTHYLSGVLLAAHGLYVVGIAGLRARGPVRSFALAAGVAAVAFLPWLVLANRIGGADYTRRNIPVWAWLQRWLINLGSIFFDVQVSHREPLFDVGAGDDVRLRLVDPSTWVVGLVVLVLVYAVSVFLRTGPTRARLFFGCLGVVALFMLVPDVVSGGQRSTVGRYLVPLYLGIGLAVAYGLTRMTTGGAAVLRRRASLAGLAFLSAVGVWTCAVSSRADTWWSKYGSYFDPEVARIVNERRAPLVLAGGPIQLLGLSHLVGPRVILRLSEGPFEPPAGDAFADVLVFSPSGAWLRSLTSRKDFSLQPVFRRGQLWRLQRTSAPG